MPYLMVQVITFLCALRHHPRLTHTPHTHRDAAIWGLCSSLFAALTISEFLYLYIQKHVKERRPKEWVLEVFGSIASVGVGAGLGGMATYLGLGIQNSLSGNGGWCVCLVSLKHDLWVVLRYLCTSSLCCYTCLCSICFYFS